MSKEKTKKPWEMTQDEYLGEIVDSDKAGTFYNGKRMDLLPAIEKANHTHRDFVQQAISEGKIKSHPDYPESNT